MIGRVLLLASLAAAPLAAELAFSVVENSTETPVNAQVQLASTAAGDTLNTLFRVRNTGAANAKLSTLTIAGSAFSLTDLPALPATLVSHAYLDFTVRFQPTSAGSFSALLKADGVSVFVLATGVPVLTVFVEENGIRRQLDAASAIDFGTVERGKQAVCHLLLVNQDRTPLTSTVSIAGGAFQLASGGAATVAVAPQNLASIDVLFAPVEPGPQQGELRIDQRRFSLRGSTVEPPLPKPIVQVDLNGREPSSGLQPFAMVRFDPPPRTHGTGKLRIDFHPSVDAGDDPAVLFLATSSRFIDFAVIEGEANAQFGPVAAMYRDLDRSDRN